MMTTTEILACSSIDKLRAELLHARDMLDRARRICTAAKRHVDWSSHWAVTPSTDALSATMRGLVEAVRALTGEPKP